MDQLKNSKPPIKITAFMKTLGKLQKEIWEMSKSKEANLHDSSNNWLISIWS